MKLERVGEVSVWWVQRPAASRVPPRVALAAVFLIVLPLVAVLVWADARGERLWPWTTVMPILPGGLQYVLRYLLLLGGGVIYVLAVSVPAWARLTRTARADLEQATVDARAGRWVRVALHLHRYGILRGELGRRPDPVVDELDRAARPHLPSLRRLYVYYRNTPPPMPETPTAGFHPRVVPLSVGGGWWTGAIVAVLAVGALADVRDAFVTGNWQALNNVSFIVVAAVLAAYAYVYAAGFLGRRSYFRFAPGSAELMQFKVRANKTRTETVLLRACDVFLDVTRSVAALSFVEHPGGRRIAEYHLSRDPQTIETCLRAVLSEAPVHSLPEGELTA